MSNHNFDNSAQHATEHMAGIAPNGACVICGWEVRDTMRAEAERVVGNLEHSTRAANKSANSYRLRAEQTESRERELRDLFIKAWHWPRLSADCPDCSEPLVTEFHKDDCLVAATVAGEMTKAEALAAKKETK